MPNTRKRPRHSHRDLFLGIDGGGTKTHSVLTGADGRIISEDMSGPSNPMRTGVRIAARTVAESAIRVCDKYGATTDDIAYMFAGLAGARRSDLKKQMETSIREAIPRAQVTVLSDAEIALFATTRGKPGAIIISGTGSVCYGLNSRGRSATAGGWGPIAGDEGGGISIAIKALRAVGRASDGRGPKTKLSKLAATYFRASTPEDLIIAIYSPQTGFTKIAGFAKDVIGAARAGDEVAEEILEEAGRELGLAVCAVLKRLSMTRSAVPVGTIGGIFNAGELIRKPLSEVVAKCAPKASLVEPSVSPAHAAALMAVQKAYQSPSL